MSLPLGSSDDLEDSDNSNTIASGSAQQADPARKHGAKEAHGGMVELDVLIKGGILIDGSGSPGTRADVGVRKGLIVAVGDLSLATANEILEVPGRIVCPGFIDVHGHSDLTPFIDPRCASKVRQGVTTELVGNCGFSAFPLVKRWNQERTELNRSLFMSEGVDADWTDCSGYLAALDRLRPALNIATQVGNGTIRTIRSAHPPPRKWGKCAVTLRLPWSRARSASPLD